MRLCHSLDATPLVTQCLATAASTGLILGRKAEPRAMALALGAEDPRGWDVAVASPACKGLGLEHPCPCWSPPVAAMGMLVTSGRETLFSCTPAHTPPCPR